MKRTRIIGLCTIAMFALSMMVVSSAVAGGENPTGPEYGICIKGGVTKDFTDANCSIDPVIRKGKEKGKYSFVPTTTVPGAGVKYTSANGVSILNTLGGREVECSGATDTGEITGPKTDVDTVTFTNCLSEGFSCNSAGDPSGTIKTKELETTIGWVNKAKGEVGTDFAGKGGGPSAIFGCVFGLVEYEVDGSVIGVTTGNINVMSATSTTTFTETAGKQTVEYFEGGPKDTLESTIESKTPPGGRFPNVPSTLSTVGVATNIPGRGGRPRKTEINTIEQS